MKNLLREKIMNGEKTVGTFFEAGNASVAEALALTDLDYMLIDTEHGPFDVESVMLMLRGAELHGTTALVRVKDSNRNSILKMLDIGAGGLIIPQVHSLEEIKKIVEYGKYFPVGQRGVAFARGAGYGYLEHAKGDINDYFATCNRETLLIPQCETKGRGGKGVKCYKITEKTGNLIGSKAVNEDNEIMMITTEGIIIRTPCSGISVMGRITSGVKLMDVDGEIKVASIAKVRDKEASEETPVSVEETESASEETKE